MANVSVSLPADGSTGTVSQYNTPITSIVNTINGGLDNSNIASAAAIATSKLADDGGITGAKIASYKVNRSNNGTTITESSAKIQTGWGAATTGTTTGGSVTVTFPVAFTNVPIVNVSFGGDVSGVSTTLGAGSGNLKQCIAEALSVTTTGFILQILTRDGTSYATNSTVFGHWTAIGI